MQPVKEAKTLFTWCGGPRSSGVGFFCFVSPQSVKTKETNPTRPGSPTPCKQALRFRISRFYFLCYHGCIKVIIPLIDIGLPQSKKVYVYKARFEYKCIKKYSNK